MKASLLRGPNNTVSAFSRAFLLSRYYTICISHQVFRIRDLTHVTHYKSHFSYVQFLSVMTKILNHKRVMMKKITRNDYSLSITPLGIAGTQTSISYCLLPLQVDKNSLSSTLILKIARTEKFQSSFYLNSLSGWSKIHP